MTQATQAAVTAIAAVVGTVSGIENAPIYPPDKANYAPIAVTYVTGGVLDNGPQGTRKDLWNIAIDVLVVMRKLDDDIKVLTPFLDTVPAALQAQVSGSGGLFSGTITNFSKTRISYIPSVDYAGVIMRGYRFTMEEVKILVAT